MSGAAALVYEISWSRQIGLLFGHTIHAASVVLATYFAGMAIGYWLGAKWSLRVRPLIGYAIAEIIVAIWACLIPLILGWTESSFAASWMTSPSFAMQTLIRVVFSFFLLLPATISLGITLPMMATYYSTSGTGDLTDSANVSSVSFGYALNTAGALAGVLFAIFYLLVNVGVIASSYLAAGLSLVCALLAIAISRSSIHPVAKHPDTLPNQTKQPVTKLALGLLTLSGLSGFGTLALQVLYTRMFSLVFHNSTYTFGIVIAVFLASLAIGAFFAGVFQRWMSAGRLAGIAIGLGGIAVTTSVSLFVLQTELKYFKSGNSFSQYMLGSTWLVTTVVAPPVVLLGMLLPLVWKLAGTIANSGKVVGQLTSFNTIAAAIGAASASFLLLPWVGLWESFVAIAAVFVSVAFILLWKFKLTWVGSLLFLGMIVAAFFTLRSPIEAEYLQKTLGEKIIQRWNSPYGWIDVVRLERSGAYKIRQNLHYRFGRTGDNAREFRQAHIPILLHKQPHDVLFLGLGTGLTAGGAVPHSDLDRIVIVELIPEVVEAAGTLADFNNNVIAHPKTEIHIDDARHFLLATDRKFDVIVSDLFVPWESESGYLYTVEHYQVARRKLKDDGIFCQWLPLFQLGQNEFESIANSFTSVFPHTTLWWARLDGSKPVLALVGTEKVLHIDSGELNSRLAKLWQEIGIQDPAINTVNRFWDHYSGDWNEPNSIPLNTDEHPRVEFLTPVSNRDRVLLSRHILKKYFKETLANLPVGSARLIGVDEDEANERRRGRQRAIFLGR